MNLPSTKAIPIALSLSLLAGCSTEPGYYGSTPTSDQILTLQDKGHDTPEGSENDDSAGSKESNVLGSKKYSDVEVMLLASLAIGGTTTIAYFWPKAKTGRLARYLAVVAGVTKSPEIKAKVYVDRMRGNLLKASEDPDFRYSKVVEGDRGDIYVGMMPDNATVNDVDSKNDRSLSILSVAEDFELQQSFEWTDKDGNLKKFEPFSPGEVTGNHMQISSADYREIDQTKISDGADFIYREVRKGRDVYVHCKSGKGRSASMVAAYLMKHRNKSYKDAADHIKAKRKYVSIHRGNHRKGLKKFEERLAQNQRNHVQQEELNSGLDSTRYDSPSTPSTPSSSATTSRPSTVSSNPSGNSSQRKVSKNPRFR